MSEEVLPAGWAAVSLHIVLAARLTNGRSVPTSDEGFPVLRLTALNGSVVDLAKRKIGRWRRADAEKYLVRAGDFLVSRGNGSIRLVGRGRLVPMDDDVAFPDTMIRVRPDTAILSPKFLRYQWDAPATRSQIERTARTTAGIHKVNQRDLERIRLVLAPLPEQHRIVAEIEKHFSHLDDAVAMLERAKVRIAQARASVLKAAVEGRLVRTEAEVARAEGRTYEPASELLKRILVERERKHHEAQAGAKRKKHCEPSMEPDAEGLPELPEGWRWSRLIDIVAPEPNAMTDGPFGSRLKSSHYVDRGVRVIRLGNLGAGEFKDDDRSFITEAYAETLKRHAVQAGDLLIAALAEPVGRCCEVPASVLPAIVKADCIRFKPHQAISSKFLMHWLNSPQGRKNAEAHCHGVGRLRINMKNMRALDIPVAPAPEQHRIVAEVERRLSVLDSVAKAVGRNLVRCANLRQAILKRAFEGKLVPQDPSDEPASALLARIEAQTV